MIALGECVTTSAMMLDGAVDGGLVASKPSGDGSLSSAMRFREVLRSGLGSERYRRRA